MIMNRSHILPLVVLACALAPAPAPGAAKRGLTEDVKLALPAQVQKFISEKEQQVKSAATKHKVELWPEVVNFFDAAKKGEWPVAQEFYRDLRHSVNYERDSKDEGRVAATAQSAALEVELALEQFAEGEPKYAEAFGRDIVSSMHKGSVYFGGTDPGRGLPTAFCQSHAKANPVFVLTQNALANGYYLTYLRDMFGGQLYVPTEEEMSRAFKDYVDGAQRRLEHDEKFPNEPRQIKPGENVQMRNNKVQVSGQVAVMAINGLLAKLVFERNPGREFFIEESYPLEWMYPHLSPHGLIMKINRKPLENLSEEVVRQDRKFWSQLQRKLIGDWPRPETPVKNICDVAETVFVEKDLDDFDGDPKFVGNPNACRTYSKLRSSIGGVYAWRAREAKDPAEKERMRREADFAFRQAFALYPGSAEAVFRYVSLLTDQKRFDDALCLAETAGKIDPGAGDFSNLTEELERLKAAGKQ